MSGRDTLIGMAVTGKATVYSPQIERLIDEIDHCLK